MIEDVLIKWAANHNWALKRGLLNLLWHSITENSRVPHELNWHSVSYEADYRRKEHVELVFGDWLHVNI